MSDATPSLAAPRHIGLALVLSLFCTGLGQIYAGRGRRGAILLSLALLHAPVLWCLSFLAPSNAVLFAMGGLVAFGAGLFVFTLVDAARVASKATRPFDLRIYNSPWLYVGLIVFAGAWEIGGMAWVRLHAFQAFRIPTQSMAPSIACGDRVLVNMHRASDLRRGDTIVFLAPGQRERNWIMRVVGLPGEEIRIEEGVVHIDGRPLGLEMVDAGEIYEETDGTRSWRVRWTSPRAREEATLEPVRVPPDHVYVLGDNRNNAVDSRRLGAVPLGDVIGVAQYVVWPGPEGRLGTIR